MPTAKYKESIIDPDFTRCHICGSRAGIEIHHAMNGPDRKKSTQYGLVVALCRSCHTGPNGVHSNRELEDRIKAEAQRAFQREYPDLDWMRIFHRNWL